MKTPSISLLLLAGAGISAAAHDSPLAPRAATALERREAQRLAGLGAGLGRSLGKLIDRAGGWQSPQRRSPEFLDSGAALDAALAARDAEPEADGDEVEFALVRREALAEAQRLAGLGAGLSKAMGRLLDGAIGAGGQ